MKLITKRCIIFLISLLFIGCTDLNKRAVGELNEIIICTDINIWEETEDLLKEIFEQELITPQNEKIFNVIIINPLQFSDYSNRKHIILLGTLDENGNFPEYIEDLLDSEMKKTIVDNRYFYDIKKDEFARGQLLMILASKNLSRLKEEITNNKAFIFNQFNNVINRSVTRSMFGKKENTKLEKKLYETYGWTLRIQPDFIVASEKNNFVWLRRFNPERMVSVYWEDYESGNEPDENWALEKRVFLGKNFLDGMKIVEDYTKTEKVIFLGRNAIKIEGLWEKETFGGFFRSYVFSDRMTKRIYLIDLAIFAPEKNFKEPFIRQLDIIVHTFTTSPLKPFKRVFLR